MYIIPGTASKSIASHLVRELSAYLADVEIRRFVDGECYVRVKSDLKDEDVIIVQTTYPDENIIEAVIMRDAVRDLNPNRIFFVIPYFGYARQDKKFLDGEAVSARAMAKIMSIDVDGIITVDPHKEYIIDFFGTDAYSTSAIPEIANYLRGRGIDVVLAPDKGAMERAKKLSEMLECDSDFLEKTRLNDKLVEIKPKNVDVKGKDVVIVDDIISTGGTMAKAVREMKRQGATKIYVACTHGLFIGDAIQKISSAGADELISTDTIETPLSKIKVAPQIARSLKKRFLS